MKKRVLVVIGLLIVLVWGVFMDFGMFSSAETTFDGSRVINDEGYHLNFKTLNRDDSYAMELKKGDVLNVAWDITYGKVDVVITSDTGEEIYVANGRGPLDHSKFQLSINEDGEYTILVSGKKAKGKFEFTKG